MNKKGFTLVELLTVIVILAIIAVIAIPIILNVIEDSKKGAAENSSKGYLDAVEKQTAINLLDDIKENDIKDGTYKVSELYNKGVTVKGNKPSDDSWITIKEGIATNYSIYVGGYTVTKDKETKKGKELETIENISYKCKRADVSTLHQEECTQTDSTYYCSGAGYVEGNKGTTIIYGNETVTDNVLTSGDAFDCDVNGDGNYDAETERFYYVSDLYDTTSNVFNEDVAVLIYYNNTTKGNPDNTANSLIAYNSNNKNYEGPVTAITNLPTVTQWSNVSLTNEQRQILTETGSTSTSGGTLPVFDYSSYSSRLLTVQEINKACGIIVSSYTIGELDNCNYLLENSKYSNSSLGTWGYWLENAISSSTYQVGTVNGSSHSMRNGDAGTASDRGSRPVIEVLKADIEY